MNKPRAYLETVELYFSVGYQAFLKQYTLQQKSKAVSTLVHILKLQTYALILF